MRHVRLIGLFTALFLVLSLGVIVTGCGDDSSPDTTSPDTTSPDTSDQVYELSWATMNPSTPDEWGEARHKAAFANWIEQESGGRIKINFYYSASLATSGEEYSAVTSGLADIGEQYSQFVSGLFPLNEALLLPWLVDWPGATQAGLAHMELYEEFPALQEEFSDVKLLFFWYGGPTQIQTTSKPIHTLEDLDGLSQVEIGPYSLEAMKLLGTVPQSFSPTDIYDALAKSVADGVSVNWTACGAFSYDELINYSTEVSLTQPGFFAVVMNLDTWNSLPADLQEIFSWENCMEWSKVYGVAVDVDDAIKREAMNAEFLAQGLPEVYVLPDDEKAIWEEITMPVRQTWIDQANELGVSGEEILEEAIRLAEEYAWDPSWEDEFKALIISWESAGQ